MNPADRQAVLLRSASALKDGRIAETVELLKSLLTASADDPEALYLLGAAHMQRGEYDAAVRLLDRVLERAPDSAPVSAMRQRAADALGRRIVEQEVCQAVLPRLLPHIADPSAPTGAAETHVVLASAVIDDGSYAQGARAAAALGLPSPSYWSERNPPLRPGAFHAADAALAARAAPIEAQRWTFPRSGFVVVAGVARSPVAWWPHCAPTGVALVVDEFVASEIVERIRQLAGDGARRVLLLYADSELARRTRLPGRVIGGER
jgi:fermentation-respiration switch protein FrsA (DUF1100 family)